MRAAALSLAALCCAAQTPARFHHVHLNAADPEAAIRFYTSKFDCEQSAYNGRAAVWAQKSWLLFDKRAPKSGPDSPVWHIGWGAEDMPAEYKRQLDSGTRFHTPLTDISDLANSPGFYYAYVDGPDHALIELNTARHHQFGHLHLFSADAAAAAEWYARYFGVKPRLPRSREPRMYRGVQVGPAASFTIDNVNVIIFPGLYRGHDRYESTRGTVFDHIAFGVENLSATLAAMRAGGVKVLSPPKGKPRAAMVEGPDKIAIELIEAPPARP